MTDRAFTAIIFSRKTGVYQRDCLFCVGVINGEVATFQDFQAERGKIVVRYRFEVAARPIAVGHIFFAVHFKLPLGIEGHTKAATHGRRIKSRVIAQRPHGTTEKFTPRIRIRIGALHQTHACGVDRVLVIAIREIELIADRLDL